MSELAQFHAFVGAQLQSGDARLSPEDVFALWLEQHSPPEDDATQAVLESLADYEAGDRGVTIDEADRLFRQQFPKPTR
jgi:hypothetical protein